MTDMHPDALDGPADPRIEQAREMAESSVCLTGIASQEPCLPHVTDLRLCAICGFAVDVAYEAKPPTVKGLMVGRPPGPDKPDPLALAIRLQSLLRLRGHVLTDAEALAVARGLGGEAG